MGEVWLGHDERRLRNTLRFAARDIARPLTDLPADFDEQLTRTILKRGVQAPPELWNADRFYIMVTIQPTTRVKRRL